MSPTFSTELIRRALTVCLLAALVATGHAQRLQNEETIRINTNLVTVPVIVTDRNGRRVTGLTKDDFLLSEDGRPVAIDYFAPGSERVALVFALDASGSVRDIIEHQREAALAILGRFRVSRVAVVRFRDRPEVALPLTDEVARARAEFRFPALPNQRTAIFDGATAAVRLFGAKVNPEERRIVILISDGLDNASRLSAEEAIAEANARQVSIYVIHLPLYVPRDGHLAPRPPSKGFRQLAERTGGRYFLVGNSRTALDPRAELDLSPVFRAIADDLASQYVLGYYAEERSAGGRFHRLEVRLRRARALRARALREGYTSRTPDGN
ncbi:MAG: hypothetical protein C4334_10775 [Pyrinomonas sp.]|uniref:VWA domain-containing protein n=1 Tax=Pyrinomonas sp. TaxID=2080306 RepID=UPI00331DACB3